VVLLEAGGPDSREWIHEPSGVIHTTFADPEISRAYMTHP
jgi:hypothetical protein